MDNGSLRPGSNQHWITEETAEHLRTSVRTIHGLASAGKIPHRKFGKRLLFNPAEIEAWLDGAELEHVRSPSGRVVRIKSQ